MYSNDEWIVDKIFKDFDSSDVDEYLLILAREGNDTSCNLSDIVTGDVIMQSCCYSDAWVLLHSQ